MALQSLEKRLNKSRQVAATYTQINTAQSLQQSREQIKQEIRNRIQLMLDSAKGLQSKLCLQQIRNQLTDIQHHCQSVGKTFIFVEEAIACHQFDLGGSHHDDAVLFRGPDERASVAVCVTQKGSLLHRNDSNWIVYRNAGDVLTKGALDQRTESAPLT